MRTNSQCSPSTNGAEEVNMLSLKRLISVDLAYKAESLQKLALLKKMNTKNKS